MTVENEDKLFFCPFILVLLICTYVVCTRQATWLGGWFDLSCVVSKSWFDMRCAVLNFLSDTSCRPTVWINMNGLFLQEPPYRKTTLKVWQNTIRTSARWCKFRLEVVCHKRQSTHYKLKEETVLYLLIHLYGGVVVNCFKTRTLRSCGLCVRCP